MIKSLIEDVASIVVIIVVVGFGLSLMASRNEHRESAPVPVDYVSTVLDHCPQEEPEDY